MKSSRVGRGAAAVAVVAVAALGMSGCAAFGGVGGGAVAEGAERPEMRCRPGCCRRMIRRSPVMPASGPMAITTIRRRTSC